VLLIATLVNNGFTCTTEEGVIMPHNVPALTIVCNDKNTSQWKKIITVNGTVIGVRSGYGI